MSESWAIAIGSGILSVMTMLLGWLASSVSGLRGDLKSLVAKDDCNRAMAGHCADIRALRAIVERNCEAIARVEAKMEGRQ